MTISVVPYSKTIPLTHCKFAIVSYWYYSWLIIWKWYAIKSSNFCYYAVRHQRVYNKQKLIYLHRFILGIGYCNITVDHIDHNGLNCTNNNLRIATYSQNGANRKASGKSKYLGVSIKKHRNKKYWRAQIQYNYKVYTLKTCPFTPCGELLSALAYDKKALELHGEFANLNFKIKKPH